MPGYKSLHPQNKNWVTLNNPSDISFWKQKFHCSAEELIRAASVAGCSANALGKFLRK
jgi:hypothetical protein